jgi:predicted PurR-regulated permease PerM
MDRTLSSGPVAWFGIIVVTCLLLVVFQTVLWLVVPILLAVVSYYALSPLVGMAMARGLTRPRAVMIVTAMLCIFLIALGGIVASKIQPSSSQWKKKIPQEVNDYLDSGFDLISKAHKSLLQYVPSSQPAKTSLAPAEHTVGVVSLNSQNNPAAAPAPSDTDTIRQEVTTWVSDSSGDFLLDLGHWLPALFLVPIITYYLLLDGPAFKRFLVQAIPNAYFEKGLYLFYRVEDQVRRYFQGVLALTLVDGSFLGVGMWLLGLPGPFFLASICAIAAWLPYVGSIAGCLLVVLVAHHAHPSEGALPYEAIALFVGVRILDDFVFMPMTIGRSLRMHPLVAILMILLGGAVAGFAGLLLVMPVLGVVMVAGQIIGELLNDPRIGARHQHAKHLRKTRAQVDLM